MVNYARTWLCTPAKPLSNASTAEQISPNSKHSCYARPATRGLRVPRPGNLSWAIIMRVAYVSADLGVPIFGCKGCSIHAQEVLAALVRRGAEIDLFSTSCEGEPTPGLDVLRLHPLPRPPKGEPAAREQAALAGNELLRTELARAGKFDLVYERYSLWSHAPMEFAQASGVPGLVEVNAPLIEEQAQ